MSVTGPISHPKNLNPTAPAFLPATNPNPIPFFFPTRIYLPLPPPPPPLPYLSFPRLPPPPLPPISMTPTRAVILSQVPPNVTESSLRRDMEVFGEVRGVQMGRADEGIVTVHFFNLKHSQRAVNEIHDLHMQQQDHFTTARGLISGQLVRAHFVFPQLKAVPEGNNQGSLVIMNLEPTVSSTTLRRIFQVYGQVKELRETPWKRQQRFVEFFDVRNAARALREMNGKVIAGKPILVQFSRPGGFTKKLFLASRHNKSFLYNHHHNHPHPPPSPPPTPPHHRRPPSQLKVKSDYQQQKTNNNNRKKPKKQMHQMKKNCSDDRFIINEDAIATTGEFRDDRTTVMIKNIPNKYNQKLFLKMLDTHCNDSNQKIINQGNNMVMSSYDFVYLPIDFSNKCNVGYGFVNMTSPEAVLRLHKALHNQRWEVFNTRKICEVTYARIQGLESLKDHFKNLKLPEREVEEYMPVFFSPPRDGQLLPEPMSIVDVGVKPVVDDDESCHSRDGTVSDKKMERSDGCCLGERIENGGV